MHIPDGPVSGTINVATAAVSAASVGLALWRVRRSLDDRATPLLGVTAAFVFAAQMINFPILGGTSGHLLGGVLAAALLGPWAGLLVMTVVLVIQALAFGDGGVTALGSNVFNMGIIGTIVGYGLFRAIRGVLPHNRASFLAAISIASWMSVVLASAACSTELALSGTFAPAVVFPPMIGLHALIGVGEAMITSAAVSVVLLNRPDLLADCPTGLPAPAIVQEPTA
jgi:cobalt/nickel transport system permease protein